MKLEIVSVAFLFCAICSANIPFINQKLFAVFLLPFQKKPVWLRLLEMIALYAVLALSASLLERYLGNMTATGWELYIITLCLFLIFAFPGFVYQYLLKKTAISSMG